MIIASIVAMTAKEVAMTVDVNFYNEGPEAVKVALRQQALHINTNNLGSLNDTRLFKHAEILKGHLHDNDFEFAFSHERHLLEQYYAIREHCYRNVENGPKEFDGGEDFYDRISDILIVKHKGKVIGGARIVGKLPGSEIHIPIEAEGICLDDIFPEMSLHKWGYCEFGRLAILENYRSMDLLKAIISSLSRRAQARHYRYLFSIAPLTQSRCYRRVFQKLGFAHPYVIHEDIHLHKSEEECGNLKMYLASLKFPDHAQLRKAANDWVHERKPSLQTANRAQ